MKRCSRCILDTSVEDIYFDRDGVCNYCHSYLKRSEYFSSLKSSSSLSTFIGSLQASSRKRPLLMGLSGGIDSAYLALLCHEWNIDVHYLHVDCGWNSNLAISNIERLVRYTGAPLVTKVVNWKTLRNMHSAYLKSGVSNQDSVQDHAFFSELYYHAHSNGYKTILTGGNFATEGIFPSGWHGNAMDALNLRSICASNGCNDFSGYRFISFLELYVINPFFRRLKILRPLNYVHYNKEEAKNVLIQLLGWNKYPGKHGESTFTRYFQEIYLPSKHGYDKRLPHLSSLINNNQITRQQALQELSINMSDTHKKNLEYFVFEKLGLSSSDLQSIRASKPTSFREYPNSEWKYRLLKKVQAALRIVAGINMRSYS